MPYRQTGSTARPDVLACAGLDPSGGAGLIADVRVLADLGARPVGVVTALTVQNTTGVVEWHPRDPEVVSHPLALAKAIANALHLTNAPVVWDPVAGPSLGNVAYHESFDDAIAALRPHLALVTPNARELALLTQMAVTDLASAEAAGRVLAQKIDAAVLIKGGRLSGDESTDLLIPAGGREELRGPRIANGEHVHGTGCALASAIAANLAAGKGLAGACREAKHYVADRIADPVHPGRGAPAVV